MSDAEVRFRMFDVLGDGRELVARRVLDPGEEIRWVSDEGVERYVVDGRGPEGRPRDPRFAWLRRMGRVLMMPVVIVGVIADGSIFGFNAPSRLPRAVIFGDRPDCEAVFDPNPRLIDTGVGMWLLTDRRFARIRFESPFQGEERGRLVRLGRSELPPEPMECKVEFEAAASSVRFRPDSEREFKRGFVTRRARYDRITLPDGSGFDIGAE